MTIVGIFLGFGSESERLGEVLLESSSIPEDLFITRTNDGP